MSLTRILLVSDTSSGGDGLYVLVGETYLSDAEYTLVHSGTRWELLDGESAVMEASEACLATQSPEMLSWGCDVAGGSVEITTVAELQAIGSGAIALSADYIQINDIDCSGHDPDGSSQGFRPIGILSAPFTGTYDGDDFEIQNLFINRPATADVALFGVVNFPATGARDRIKNVHLRNTDITGSLRVGALVGSDGVTNTTFANIGAIYLNCTATTAAAKKITAQGNTVGGLFGALRNHARYCWADCDVRGAADTNVARTSAGGFAGFIQGYTPIPLIVEDCYALGDVTGALNIGSFCGQPSTGVSGYNPTIRKCYGNGSTTSIVVADTSTRGGAIGVLSGATNPVQQAVYYNSTNCAKHADNNISGVTGLTDAEMKDKTKYAGWNFFSVWNINPAVNGGYPYIDVRSEGLSALLGCTKLMGGNLLTN
jgi:hypothetical protein